MVIEISEYYKNKGYTKAYLATNKEPRRVCTLRKDDGTMTVWLMLNIYIQAIIIVI